MSPDLINGLFELGGAAFLLLNVRRMYRDKELRGVHWSPAFFFTTWGLWNLFYYPHLDQWWSFAGGLAIVSVNAAWLGQVAYYLWRQWAGYSWVEVPYIDPEADFDFRPGAVNYASTKGMWVVSRDTSGVKCRDGRSLDECGGGYDLQAAIPHWHRPDCERNDCPHGWEDWDCCPACCH